MAKASVQTNLLGRKAKITMGMNDEQIAERNRNRWRDDNELWSNLGRIGEIVAVAKQSDSFLLGVQLETGQVVEPYLKHIRVLGDADAEAEKSHAPYHFVGLRGDNSVAWKSQDYPSRGYCYASATKTVIEVSADGNPEHLVRVEMRDKDGKQVSGYEYARDLVVQQGANESMYRGHGVQAAQEKK